MEEHTGEVDVDGWWSEVDRKMLEAAAFRSATPGKIEVQKMAPWIPPACRSATVFNSEVHKGEIVYLLHGLCMCTLS